jgi:hypothetical protein
MEQGYFRGTPSFDMTVVLPGKEYLQRRLIILMMKIVGSRIL